MKQEMITFLSTLKDEIFELTKYLYNNPEESFHEYKAYNYISSLLNKYNFEVTPSYLGIPTSFYAQYGKGHPKVCFICEYDALKEKGHVYGYNAKTAISIASALALSKVIPKLGGSAIVIGCPGEILSGSKVAMTEQGTFEDIDAVLMVQPHTITAESGSSMAIVPLQIKYTDNSYNNNTSTGKYSALDACLFTFDALNVIAKGFENNCFIGDINVNSITDSFPESVEAKFSIKTSSTKIADEIENKIESFIKLTCSLLNVSSELHLYSMPCKELITNPTISRLFSHNLKESGIINISGIKNIFSSLNLGNVSHVVPCIHPYVSIVNDNSIAYGTEKFAAATVTEFASDAIMKAAQALSCTAFDIIDKQSLIADAKTELSRLQTSTLQIR
ncbi:metal-dependent hydrolase [Clostridium neuense]|uniref:Peptidase M20 domain-containing protein 2 n=1 Tax=Clostridium neuense TaxID=1728934 RepID=A0ABW8TL70_9CLOT